MRIGLLSDTHIPWEDKALPPQVLEIFKGVDLILHAGDIYSHTVLDDLEKIAPVYAALGDDDYPGDDTRVQERHLLHLEGKNLFLIHEGPGLPISPEGLPLWWQRKISGEKDKYFNPDIIVAGHEHRVIVETSGGILYINPGSPTLLHYQRGPGTVGILTLNSGEPHVEIIHL